MKSEWHVYVDGRLRAEADNRESAENYKKIMQHKQPKSEITILRTTDKAAHERWLAETFAERWQAAKDRNKSINRE